MAVVEVVVAGISVAVSGMGEGVPGWGRCPDGPWPRAA